MIPVGVFAKPPLPGLVKTRLMADIGAAKATRVYRYCLGYALDVARHSGLDYAVYLSQESDEAPFNEEQYRLQKGRDLGERMLNALQDMLDDGASAWAQARRPRASHELEFLRRKAASRSRLVAAAIETDSRCSAVSAGPSIRSPASIGSGSHGPT